MTPYQRERNRRNCYNYRHRHAARFYARRGEQRKALAAEQAKIRYEDLIDELGSHEPWWAGFDAEVEEARS